MDNKARVYAAIEAYIKQQMQRLRIPGLVMAIVEGDQIVHQRGFGRAHPGGAPPTPQTPFMIGSLSKSITALAILQLVEGGKIELDAPVQRYLPWFRVADPQASAQMSVRHLLNQTSGMPWLASEIALDDYDENPAATERQVRALASLKLKRPVGAAFEYSNFNFNILGLVVEAASGLSYTDYIQKHIFKPLEMQHSYTSRAEAVENGLAAGHRYWFGHPIPAGDMPFSYSSLPSGQLIASAEDMAHYLIAHLNGGQYQNVQILSPTGIDELHSGVIDYIVFGKPVGKYGMGWFEIDLGKTKTYSHGGNVPDFSAFMALIPEQKKGLVLLLNADPYGLPPVIEELGMGATALLAGQQPPPVRLDFIKWLFHLLPLIPILQILGMVTTFRRLKRWEREPDSRPSSGRLLRQHLLLPLIPNLSLAGMNNTLRSSGAIRFIQLFWPDLALIIRTSGDLAGKWAVLRTLLVLRSLRKFANSANKKREPCDEQAKQELPAG